MKSRTDQISVKPQLHTLEVWTLALAVEVGTAHSWHPEGPEGY